MSNKERARRFIDLANDATERAEIETHGQYTLAQNAEIQTHLLWACVLLLEELVSESEREEECNSE